jgi:hypothetical protein
MTVTARDLTRRDAVLAALRRQRNRFGGGSPALRACVEYLCGAKGLHALCHGTDVEIWTGLSAAYAAETDTNSKLRYVWFTSDPMLAIARAICKLRLARAQRRRAGRPGCSGGDRNVANGSEDCTGAVNMLNIYVMGPGDELMRDMTYLSSAHPTIYKLEATAYTAGSGGAPDRWVGISRLWRITIVVPLRGEDELDFDAAYLASYAIGANFKE